MSKQKTERLLSLVVCLLSARRYLTAGQIRDAVPGYPGTFDAFKRMFERDKDELRELGIPLETGTNGTDEEVGYRISRQAYELPEIRLEPDEAAVLGLAARVWRQAELAGAAAGALLKLRAAGIDAEETTQPGIEPRLRTAEAAFAPALAGGQGPAAGGVRLPGRRPRGGAAQEPGAVGRGEQVRPLVRSRVRPGPGRGAGIQAEPDRRAGQLHRATRLGHGPGGHGRAQDGPGHRTARRRRCGRPCCGSAPAPATGCAAGPARSGRCGEDGWDLVEAPFSDAGWYADYIASFGADVVVIEPVDLREAVIRRLKGALA